MLARREKEKRKKEEKRTKKKERSKVRESTPAGNHGKLVRSRSKHCRVEVFVFD